MESVEGKTICPPPLCGKSIKIINISENVICNICLKENELRRSGWPLPANLHNYSKMLVLI